MSSGRFRYVVVTPVRDDETNLRRLAASLAAQTLPPARWFVVDTGSTDRTRSAVDELARDAAWITPLDAPSPSGVARGAPIVRAFHAGVAAVAEEVDAVVKLDADISFDDDHYARLFAAFERDPQLGIASGACYERDARGVWRRRHGTGPGVWGANRAYRRTCLEQILPLEERMGWDTVDLVKATIRGWRALVIDDVPFRHHRVEGEREGSRARAWSLQGRVSHYLGYRLSYVLARTTYQAARDPRALALLRGYLGAALRREGQCEDAEVRRHVREGQRLRRLPARAAEARRPRDPLRRGTT